MAHNHARKYPHNTSTTGAGFPQRVLEEDEISSRGGARREACPHAGRDPRLVRNLQTVRPGRQWTHLTGGVRGRHGQACRSTLGLGLG